MTRIEKKQARQTPLKQKVEQLPFDFPLLNAQSFDDFAIGESNKSAVKLLNLWPNWGHHALMVVGPNACGKSHLINSFKNQYGGMLIDPLNLPSVTDISAGLNKENPIILMDNAHLVSDETGFFHIFNSVKEAGGWLLLTALKPPQFWAFTLPDLSSRLKAVPYVEISLPDEGLLRAVLIKQFSDHQLRVNDAVISFLIKRMERSFEGANRLVSLIDNAALSEGKNITVPLAKEAIKIYEEQYV